jgi:hypothetical protein
LRETQEQAVAQEALRPACACPLLTLDEYKRLVIDKKTQEQLDVARYAATMHIGDQTGPKTRHDIFHKNREISILTMKKKQQG